MKSRQFFILSALALAASLTACGGGGGGDTPVATGSVGTGGAPVTVGVDPLVPAVSSTVASPLTSTIVATVAAPTYDSASEESAAFTLLNAERSRCGFGLLSQNTALDASARGHSDYQVLNNVITHVQTQTSTTRGFTGTLPVDRAIAQGYVASVLDTNFVRDELVQTITTDKTGRGANGVRGLLNAPYHLRAMLSGARDVGVSVRNGQDNGIPAQPGVLLTIDLSSKKSDGEQVVGPNEVVSYPCQGTTGVRRLLSNESPNPVPGRDLFSNPLGSTVYLATRPGNVLVITNASMTQTSTGQPVALRAAITATNDPNKIFLSNEAYISAENPLNINTSYQATISGTNNGQGFNQSFVFTTGL